MCRNDNIMMCNEVMVVRRQNTFRPVFAPLLRSARPERKRVTQLRRLLADGGLLYDQLKTTWQEDKLEGNHPHIHILHLCMHALCDVSFFLLMVDRNPVCKTRLSRVPPSTYLHRNAISLCSAWKGNERQ